MIDWIDVTKELPKDCEVYKCKITDFNGIEEGQEMSYMTLYERFSSHSSDNNPEKQIYFYKKANFNGLDINGNHVGEVITHWAYIDKPTEI